MAYLLIPVDQSLAGFDESVALDNVVFTLSLKWNSRDSSWYMDVYDVSGNLLRGGLRLVENWPLLQFWRDSNRPAGEIYVLPNGTVDRPPDLYELGSLFDFTYVEKGSV